MLNLESWRALGSRKGGVTQGPQGALKPQPPRPQQRRVGPQQQAAPTWTLSHPGTPISTPAHQDLLGEGPARACLKQLGFQPNVQWTWGRHLPGRVGSWETPAAGPGRLLSTPCRGGRAWTWSPGPLDAAHSAHRGRTSASSGTGGFSQAGTHPGVSPGPGNRRGQVPGRGPSPWCLG